MEPDPRGSMGLGGISGGGGVSLGTSLIAIDDKTGKIIWRKPLNGGSVGLLSTAGGVQIGGLQSPPETFMLDGRQHLLFSSGGSLVMFVLNQRRLVHLRLVFHRPRGGSNRGSIVQEVRMRLMSALVCLLVAIVVIPAAGRGTSGVSAEPAVQAQAPAAQADGSLAIKDGGVFVPGWVGKIDANEEKAGLVLANAKLSQEGAALRVTTGPAVTYWNPKNVATGTYTVKATFNEPKYMNVNSHPHPYGIVIGGNDMGTPEASYLYCAAYGSGVFIVRGFGPAPFQMNGRRGAPAPSVNKAAGPGSPVTQEIAVSVTPDSVACAINGAVVATYPKAEVVGPGKLKSTDGVYGIRFAHNTDGVVTGLAVTK